MWSTPEMTPLAMAGAAPRTTTNVMAVSESLNSSTASGSQAMVGLGHSPSHVRERRPGAAAMGTSRASSPAISASWSVSGASCISSAMAADLLAESVGDQAGHGGHLGVVEAPRTGDVDPELVDD